jgi:hypothetical protein
MSLIKIDLNKKLIIGDGSVKDGWPTTQILFKKFQILETALSSASQMKKITGSTKRVELRLGEDGVNISKATLKIIGYQDKVEWEFW